jgi:hypothetical protein
MFIDKKIVLTQFTMMCFAVVSIILSILAKELTRINSEILVVHSIITAGMLVMLAIKYYLKEELKRKQLLR